LIAAKFIMTQDFQRLNQLTNEAYCTDLMILTRDLLSKKFTTKEINYLVKGDIKKDSLLYISKTDLANIESGVRDKKKMMCNGIAKFYVRIAHVFSAIISTISPNWKAGASANGNSAPDFCKVRIDSLLKSAQMMRDENGKDQYVSVQPTVCSLYGSGSPMSAQPGFPDLDLLYNDIYDFEKGVFNRRSQSMDAKYKADLTILFKAFTGSSNKPDNITRFSDINIVSLAKRVPECGAHVPTAQPAPVPEISKTADQDPRVSEKIEIERVRKNAELQDKYIRTVAANLSGSFAAPPKGVFKQNGAYSDYVGHVNTMISNAERSRNNLIKILDKMFLIVTVDSKPKITIHPTLTSEALDSLVNQTRDQIMQLYMGCERDFYTGMKLLRVIVEEKMQENMEAALIKLKADTRGAIKKVIEQKRETVAASEKQGLNTPIRDNVFSSNHYDVKGDEDKIKEDQEKQMAINAAIHKETIAKEEVVTINKAYNELQEEIINTKQMIDVIKKKQEAAKAQNDASKTDSSTKALDEVNREMEELNLKLVEIEKNKASMENQIKEKQDDVVRLTNAKNALLLKP
jgi:Mg2+ and Co2+ transporter CorA